jgi:hypothetical protein
LPESPVSAVSPGRFHSSSPPGQHPVGYLIMPLFGALCRSFCG